MTPSDTFHALAHAALIDGELQAEEKPILRKYGARLGLEREEMQAILAAQVRGEAGFPAELPKDLAERGAMFRALVEVVIADAEVADEEFELLVRIGRSIGLERDRVSRAIRHAMAAEEATGDLPKLAPGDAAGDAGVLTCARCGTRLADSAEPTARYCGLCAEGLGVQTPRPKIPGDAPGFGAVLAFALSSGMSGGLKRFALLMAAVFVPVVALIPASVAWFLFGWNGPAGRPGLVEMLVHPIGLIGFGPLIGSLFLSILLLAGVLESAINAALQSSDPPDRRVGSFRRSVRALMAFSVMPLLPTVFLTLLTRLTLSGIDLQTPLGPELALPLLFLLFVWPWVLYVPVELMWSPSLTHSWGEAYRMSFRLTRTGPGRSFAMVALLLTPLPLSAVIYDAGMESLEIGALVFPAMVVLFLLGLQLFAAVYIELRSRVTSKLIAPVADSD